MVTTARRLARAIVSALRSGRARRRTAREHRGGIANGGSARRVPGARRPSPDAPTSPPASASWRGCHGHAMPAHVHLLLADTRRPSRSRSPGGGAAGEVVDLDTADLAFRPEEVAALARLHDGDGSLEMPDPRGLALTRHVGADCRRSATSDYLWEEIVASLSPGRPSSPLLAMITLGWGTARDVAAVTRTPRSKQRQLAPARPVGAARRRRQRRGKLRVHPILWEDGNISESSSTEDIAGARARTLALPTEHRRGAAARVCGDPVGRPRWPAPGGPQDALVPRQPRGAARSTRPGGGSPLLAPHVRQQPELRLLVARVATGGAGGERRHRRRGRRTHRNVRAPPRGRGRRRGDGARRHRRARPR